MPLSLAIAANEMWFSTYTQKNVAVTCTNSLSTTWFAVTDGTLVYGGTTYYSEVITPYNTYDCGT